MHHWTAADIPDLAGRRAVVTGANSGLGLEVSRVLAAHGASVVLACRNLAKADAAADQILASTPGANLRVRQLDLGDLGSVAAFAAGMNESTKRIDLLVNNAGLMGTDLALTVDGFEEQFGVNHLGAYALTLQLLPLLTAAAPTQPAARIVAVSSIAHRNGQIDFTDPNFLDRGYGRWRAYGQSKLANLLFTLELQRRLVVCGARAIALTAHPGLARTDLGAEGNGITSRAVSAVMPVITAPVASGALPLLRAAADPSLKGGEFIGPRLIAWGDPVQERPGRRARDFVAARRLWDLSAQLTGVGPDIAGLCSRPSRAPRQPKRPHT